MHPDDKAAVLGYLQQVKEQGADWRLALEQAELILSNHEPVDTTSVYAVQWDRPDGMGGVLWDHSQFVAETVYKARRKILEDFQGAHVRMYKIDAVETITCAVEGEILAMDDMDSEDSLPDGYEIVKRETVGL